MKQRVRITRIRNHVTTLDVDYELINKNGERDTIAGTVTEYGVSVMCWDTRPELSIAKEKLRGMGYTVANF